MGLSIGLRNGAEVIIFSCYIAHSRDVVRDCDGDVEGRAGSRSENAVC